MAKGFWDDYDKKQKRIMEERDKALTQSGKKFPPVTVGNRTPGKQTPAKQTKKKK